MEETERTRFTIPELTPHQSNRIHTLIDMLYLMNTTWLYIMSFIYPFFGIIMGVVLSQGSISASGKKIGRICLILGIINLVLALIFTIIFVIIGDIFQNLTRMSYI